MFVILKNFVFTFYTMFCYVVLCFVLCENNKQFFPRSVVFSLSEIGKMCFYAWHRRNFFGGLRREGDGITSPWKNSGGGGYILLNPLSVRHCMIFLGQFLTFFNFINIFFVAAAAAKVVAVAVVVGYQGYLEHWQQSNIYIVYS